MSVKILIDSSSDINIKQAQEMGVELISMAITFGEEEFYDGIDLFPEEFYKKLTTQKTLPKTAQINAYRFEEAFEKLTADGSEVIAIVLSSKLSGTYESAIHAKQRFNDKVFVVDSLSATMGERLLCQYALSLIKCGLSASQIFNALEKAKNNLCIMGVLDTLEYLKKGGRISGAVAFVGGLLNLKPVVRVVDGSVKMIGKARGQKKGLEMVTQVVEQDDGVDLSMPYGYFWTGDDKSKAENFVQNNAKLFGDDQQVRGYIIGSTIGTHLGPGVVGIAYFKK